MIDGRYYIECTNQAGNQSHRGEIKLYQKDEELAGSMIPVTAYWASTPFRGGKVEGNHFSFTAYWGTPCQQYSMEVEGEINGSVIAGRAKNLAGSYVFEGKRIAE